MSTARTDRTWRVKVLLALLTFQLSLLSSQAQEDPEYRLEIGAGAGTVAYLGDYNGSLLKGMQPWGTLTGKYRMNPRAAVALSLSYGKLKGSSDNAETYYPMEPQQFSNGLLDASLRLEYNFWPFGTGREYRGARRLTPFIALGLGTARHGGAEANWTLQAPLGAGIKYKMADRLNLTAEWTMHFSASDYLDGVKDPYGVQSSGLFKNTDCYSVLQVAITYDLWAKCKTCNSDRY